MRLLLFILVAAAVPVVVYFGFWYGVIPAMALLYYVQHFVDDVAGPWGIVFLVTTIIAVAVYFSYGWRGR